MAKSRLCSIPACGKPHEARGYCDMHYHRLRAHGDPLKTLGASHGEPERFYQEKVIPYDGDNCLYWPYNRGTDGYGRMVAGSKTSIVSRRVCEEINGPPPTPEHEAAHSCGNGKLGCVTKGHLSWKTNIQNKDDELAHGTRNRGERHGQAKLAESEAREILALRGHVHQSQIAWKYRVSRSAISHIQNGRSWAWLQE